MLRYIMVCASIMLVTLVVTQLILPALKGNLLFPIFRRKLRKAEVKLQKNKEQSRISELEAQAFRIELDGQKQLHDVIDDYIDNGLKQKR